MPHKASGTHLHRNLSSRNIRLLGGGLFHLRELDHQLEARRPFIFCILIIQSPISFNTQQIEQILGSLTCEMVFFHFEKRLHKNSIKRALFST